MSHKADTHYKPEIVRSDGRRMVPVQSRQDWYATPADALRVLHRALAQAQHGLIVRAYVTHQSRIVAEVAL